MSPHPDKQESFRALIGSGFTPTHVQASPNYHLFTVSRTEQLGSKIRYMIAVAASRLSRSDVDALVKESTHEGAVLVLVGEAEHCPDGVSLLTYPQFLDRLGGPIFSLLPFDEEYPDRLITLGHNTLPAGLIGKPDDLFEQYVHTGLQFLFRSRVVRYGQERRGEAVPDGIAIGRSIPLILYDAKAAGDGYKMSMEAVRQFSDYVTEFHRSYETLVGRIGYFLVVSGSFADGEDALEERSRDVQAKCGVPLSFLATDVLAGIVRRLVWEPLCRPMVNWSRVFARPVMRLEDVEKQLRARAKDGVVSLPRGG